MSKNFYPVSKQEMGDFLEAQGFRPMSLDNCNELVWGKVVDFDGRKLSMRVYSAINPDGHSRPAGKDAIRVSLFIRTDDGIMCCSGDKRVHRVPTWATNLQKRIDNWRENVGPACPACGAPTKERKGKFGKFFGCSTWRLTKCNGKSQAA